MDLAKLRSAVAANFSWILLGGFLLGLYLPLVDRLPHYVPALALGAQIFFSSFRIVLADLEQLQPVRLSLFYSVRFLALPAALAVILGPLNPELAASISLFFLLPPATATPGIAAIIGANVPLSLFIVAASSLLTPFLLSGLFGLIGSQALAFDVPRLFWSSTALVLLPIVVHLPFRRCRPATAWIVENNGLLAAPLIAVTTITAVSKQRDWILAGVLQSMGAAAVSFICYLLLYFGAWAAARNQDKARRLSYCLASGTNNITLGLVIALLNFPSSAARFMALAHASWIFALILFKRIVVPGQSNRDRI